MNNSPQRLRWLFFTALSLGTVIVVPRLPAPYSGVEMLTATVGGIWALAFYIQQRDAERARFLKELMTEFNARYDTLNDRLQSALTNDGEFTESQKMAFIDYFNLSSEEWLFWKKGYVDDEVWSAWQNGMRQYSADDRVTALWLEEKESDSYYGFELPKSN